LHQGQRSKRGPGPTAPPPPAAAELHACRDPIVTQRGVTRPVLGGVPQETFLGSTHSTPPATGWHSGILAQLAISLGQRVWEGEPRVGVGWAQTRDIGRTGSGRGSVVGLVAWFPCTDFIQVLCVCSACAGRAAVVLAGARLSRASPELGPINLLRYPPTAPGVVAGATLAPVGDGLHCT